MAPARNTAKAPSDAVISGLNGTASALAVYASSAGLLRTRRKTRFWLLAKLYQAGLVTRRVPTKGFQDESYISSSFPKLFLAQAENSGEQVKAGSCAWPHATVEDAVCPPN